MGPLMMVWMPISFSTGSRVDAGKRKALKALEIGLQQFAAKGKWRKPAMETLRAILPTANRKGAGVGLEVEVVVGVTQRGKARIERELLFSQEILVLDDACSERQPGHAAHALGPEAGAVHENIASDGTAIGDDASHAAILVNDLLDAHALLDPRAVHARALGIGHGERIGIDVPVARNEGRAFNAVVVM